MNISRSELLPGVFLNYLHSDKFKTGCMSISLLTQLNRETASLNALIPPILRRGTSLLPDMEAISRRLDELYGSAVEPVVRKIGEIQCVGFYASIPEDDFIPGGGVLIPAAELMCQLLISPATRGGLLLPDYVESEKKNLADLIRSRLNDKRSYSVNRCVEEMCCCEDFSVSRYGTVDQVESINYKKLTKHYRSLLQTAPAEIFYCGRGDEKTLRRVLKAALAPMPRGKIDYDIGTDVRMNALEDKVRFVQQEMDVTQGKLVMGFRLGECMEDPDIPAIYVFNCVFGSGTTSKLFMNVREKLSLCYYASSVTDTHKGIMLVHSGIEFDKLDTVRDEILAQLESVRKGKFTPDELSSAKACVISDLRAIADSQGELEGFYLSQLIDGLDYGPLELSGLVEEVTAERVIAIADSIEPDLFYFLCRGEDENDDCQALPDDEAEKLIEMLSADETEDDTHEADEN